MRIISSSLLAITFLFSASAFSVEIPPIIFYGKIVNKNSANYFEKARKLLKKPEVEKHVCENYLNTPPLIAGWRDNHVPISDAQNSIDQMLDTVPATEVIRNKWHKWVESVYQSNVTNEEIQVALNKKCGI